MTTKKLITTALAIAAPFALAWAFLVTLATIDQLAAIGTE